MRYEALYDKGINFEFRVYVPLELVSKSSKYALGTFR